ncbi:MAG: hypothetical protein MOB07_23160 [Acidobacteria bacterium]|nr:hypothetical protein [Acidobacteriota bacterium]
MDGDQVIELKNIRTIEVFAISAFRERVRFKWELGEIDTQQFTWIKGVAEKEQK